MDGFVLKVRGEYVVPDVKEFMLSESSDINKLPTMDTLGSFEEPSMNDYCAFGSLAYTADYTYIVSLGIDNVWHEV